MDMSAAKKYLINSVGENKETFDFESWNAVFIKGIFKDVICSIANTVKNYRRKDEKHLSDAEIHEKPLLWKLSDYKRENLFEMMAKGMVKTNVEPQKIVERPIFQNLYNLKYRSDPETWKNADYGKYLDKTVKETPKVHDPLAINKDDFTNQINFIVADYQHEIEAFNKLISEE